MSEDVSGKLSLMAKTKDFEGFDANGYFKTGKPLLSSFSANFVTFMIILIQFRNDGQGSTMSS